MVATFASFREEGRKYDPAWPCDRGCQIAMRRFPNSVLVDAPSFDSPPSSIRAQFAIADDAWVDDLAAEHQRWRTALNTTSLPVRARGEPFTEHFSAGRLGFTRSKFYVEEYYSDGKA